MGGPCECDGTSHQELDNFYQCGFTADGVRWQSSEQCYQAAKFPDDPAQRERIRQGGPGMESWKLGNADAIQARLRPDWEEVKVDEMYRANLAKFSQNPHLRQLLAGSSGPITAQGGLFWKTWNEILLERIREELRGFEQQDVLVMRRRVELMAAYREAVKAGDQRRVEAVTRRAARREKPPTLSEDADAFVVEGHDASRQAWLGRGPFRVDLLVPEANGQPHYVNAGGGHLYLGAKGGRRAWCLDEVFSPKEACGQAFLELPESGDGQLPAGERTWQYFDEAQGRHFGRLLAVRAQA